MKMSFLCLQRKACCYVQQIPSSLLNARALHSWPHPQLPFPNHPKPQLLWAPCCSSDMMNPCSTFMPWFTPSPLPWNASSSLSTWYFHPSNFSSFHYLSVFFSSISLLLLDIIYAFIYVFLSFYIHIHNHISDSY